MYRFNAALQSLESNISVREDLIIKTRHILLNIRNLGVEVQFCWVPAHIGIKGNEKADKIRSIGKRASRNEYLNEKRRD